MHDPLPGLDLDPLHAYLAREHPGLVRGPLTGELIPGGRSNLTYRVTDGHHRWVLRRPPLGHVLATAHDVAREHRVLTALATTPVPVPATVLLCTDTAVLGAPFYLMEEVEGTVYRTGAQTVHLSDLERERLTRTLIDTLADLHRVDPKSIGLRDFGRPEGFLARQVRRWSTQLAASRSRDLPGAHRLADQLAATTPAGGPPAIVHGDYRLDNMLVRAGAIVAVLDWEMATLGDPLTDLGLLLVYWDGPAPPAPAAGGDDRRDAGNPRDAGNAGDAAEVADGAGPRHGFPASATLTGWYAARTGADLSALDWYVALASFKLAVILEGIHYRYTRGQTVGAGFDRIGARVIPLLEHGLDSLARVRTSKHRP